jgi:hypothetical protein
MNFTRRRSISLLLAVIALSAATASAEGALIAGLRKRIDATQMLAQRGLRTAMSAGRPMGKTRVDVSALLEAIEDGTGLARGASWARLSQANGEETAEFDGRRLALTRATGRLILRDSRGYAPERSTRAADAALLAHAKRMLGALGARSGEATYHVTSLMAASSPIGTGSPLVEEVARKVMVNREVAGVPVEGDHLVLTYTLDGRLRKALGNWHDIDYDRSRLATVLTDAEVVDRALKRVEDESLKSVLSVADQGEVRVRTVFVPVQDSDGQFIFRPQGRIDVPTVGPNGNVTSVYDFDL